MYMLHHESHVPVHLHYESHLLPPCNDKAHRFSHYFENIGEIAAAASTTSMTSPDQVAAPRQNHREGTGSRASDGDGRTGSDFRSSVSIRDERSTLQDNEVLVRMVVNVHRHTVSRVRDHLQHRIDAVRFG
jgi:hypothetical protein